MYLHPEVNFWQIASHVFYHPFFLFTKLELRFIYTVQIKSTNVKSSYPSKKLELDIDKPFFLISSSPTDRATFLPSSGKGNEDRFAVRDRIQG